MRGVRGVGCGMRSEGCGVGSDGCGVRGGLWVVWGVRCEVRGVR